MRLAEKDAYTEAHTRAVALRVVEVGEELGLADACATSRSAGSSTTSASSRSRTRSCRSRPPSTTMSSWSSSGTRAGRELLEELGGFSPLVVGLVLDHHERLDGSGYPRGLSAEELDLETRILAVCDVYDALVSAASTARRGPRTRPSPCCAAKVGTAFDLDCVAAIERIGYGESPAPEPDPEPAGGAPGSARGQPRLTRSQSLPTLFVARGS